MGRRRRSIAATAAALVVAAALSGCSRSIKASDIVEVTQPAAQKALVVAEDMPDGWATSPADEDDATGTTYEPARCAALGDKPTAASRMATVSYERGGLLAAAFVETIYRPENKTPAQEVSQLRDLVQQCASYRFRRGDTKGYAASVALLEVKKQATDTLAVRTSISGSMSEVSDTIVWVAAGDAIARFDSIAAGDGMTQKDLERLVKKSLSRLKK